MWSCDQWLDQPLGQSVDCLTTMSLQTVRGIHHE